MSVTAAVLSDRIRDVLDLHQPDEDGYCTVCFDDQMDPYDDYPCLTVAILDPDRLYTPAPVIPVRETARPRSTRSTLPASGTDAAGAAA